MQTSSLIEKALGGQLAMARALFQNGDYEEVVAVCEPLIADGDAGLEERFAAFLLKASSQSELGRYVESLNTLRDAGPLLDEAPARQKASYYGQRAHVNTKLKQEDGPLVDYEAARFWAQEAKDVLIEARVRNNLARLYSKCGQFVKAIIEVDAAIKIASRLNDDINLGRFYDQKAQVLIDHDRPAEAVACSKKAISFLANHPALDEARTTHGRALIKLGASYLEQQDPLETFCARRDAAKFIQVTLDPNIANLALQRSHGHVLEAARLLGVRHSALQKIAAKHNLSRQPIRRRNKSLFTK